MENLSEPYFREIELDHLNKLFHSGFDYSCSECGYMYREKPSEGCEICDSRDFLRTTELIKKIGLDL